MGHTKVSSERTPIYRDAGFSFENIAQAEEAFNDERATPQSSSSFIYTRFGNPTVINTEEALAHLEGSMWALLTSSGMSAIDVALSIFQQKGHTGTWLFFSELYGGTNTYIDEVLVRRRAITVERFTPKETEERFDTERLAELLDDLNPQLIFFEPVTNPLLIVADGAKIIQMAQERNIKVIVDNTFATPYLWHPLEIGADIVIHSATKYLSGHGNITAGVVCGNDPELRKQAMIYRKLVGMIASPDDAYRLGTQLLTFPLRFPTQCENAHRLAQRLKEHEAAKRVRYPSLESHVTHHEAKRLFGGKDFGAIVTFELKGGREACDLFIKNVSDHISFVPTLGNAESILLYVPTVFGEDKFPFPGMIRLSVGFEPYNKIEETIIGALDACKTIT